MTNSLEPVSPDALVQSLDTLRALPTLLVSHNQAQTFDESGFHQALNIIQTALHRLDRQASILYLEQVMNERGLESLTFEEDGGGMFLVSVAGKNTKGKAVDSEKLEDVAEAINCRMDALFEQFIRDFLMDEDEPITLDRLKEVAHEALGPDFIAGREAEALHKALPGSASAPTKRAKSRM